jgi:uncharacterized protein YndB with AHSA1/START domain
MSPVEAKSAAEAAKLSDLVLETRIEASPADVWRALTDDIASWWPRVFYCGGGSGTGTIKMEAWPGGRMYEEWGDGDGLLWATIHNVQREKSLEMVGAQGPEWGGPTTWIGGFKLEPDGSGTRLRFREAGVGRVDEANLREKEKGWRFLLDGALRAHCEGRPAPEWAD